MLNKENIQNVQSCGSPGPGLKTTGHSLAQERKWEANSGIGNQSMRKMRERACVREIGMGGGGWEACYLFNRLISVGIVHLLC